MGVEVEEGEALMESTKPEGIRHARHGARTDEGVADQGTYEFARIPTGPSGSGRRVDEEGHNKAWDRSILGGPLGCQSGSDLEPGTLPVALGQWGGRVDKKKHWRVMPKIVGPPLGRGSRDEGRKNNTRAMLGRAWIREALVERREKDTPARVGYPSVWHRWAGIRAARHPGRRWLVRPCCKTVVI